MRTDAWRRRALFDEAAELYDRARPAYPTALIQDLARLSGVGPSSRVLEIGPGTGQLTVPLAGLGCEIVAVELGPSLAAVARRNLARFPRVTIITSSIESWSPPREPFDLVVSASAFHWLDPATRVAMATRPLALGGTLAVVHTHHVAGGDQEFFESSQNCYRRWDPNTRTDYRLPTVDEVPKGAPELDDCSELGDVDLRRYEWELPYTTEAYRDLLLTYSDHRALDPAPREGLLACISVLIDARFGGRIVKRHLTELRIARRIAT
jgi:protein-L-isoaspartate O-methyltransferase